MVTGLVTPSQETQSLRPILEGAFTKLLSSIDCQNIWYEELRPVTTNDELFNLLRVHKGDPQGLLEGWFFRRSSITNERGRLGAQRYPQVHALSVQGMAYHHDFHSSYQYIQDKTEELMWVIEKNKNFLSGEIDAVTVSSARFSFEQFGELYLYRSETSLSVHRSITESDGRAFA